MKGSLRHIESILNLDLWLVWVLDICFLASEGAEGSSFGKGSLRKVNLGCKARIHTCGSQKLPNMVFQSYPGQVGTLSAFCGKDSNLVPCHDQTQMC